MNKLTLVLGSVALIGATFTLPVVADHNRTFFTNENIGRIVGTGLGAYTGSKVGKGRGNDAAIAVGAVGGYMLGGKVGRDWRSKHGQKKHSHRYSAKRAKKTGYLYPVQAMPELEVMDQIYQAKTRSNVRGGPSMKYVIVEGLNPGEPVRVLGRVVETNWLMIAQDDVIQGFVHMNLLEPAPQYYSYNYQ